MNTLSKGMQVAFDQDEHGNIDLHPSLHKSLAKRAKKIESRNRYFGTVVDRDDLKQEAMIQIWERSSKFKETDKEGLVYLVGKDQMIRAAKGERRGQLALMPKAEATDDTPVRKELKSQEACEAKNWLDGQTDDILASPGWDAEAIIEHLQAKLSERELAVLNEFLTPSEGVQTLMSLSRSKRSFPTGGQVAAVQGVSREWVSQVRKRARVLLRSFLNNSNTGSE